MTIVCTTERGAMRKRSRRGAVALEYILIAALVAIALSGALRAYGSEIRNLLGNVIWNSSGALTDP